MCGVREIGYEVECNFRVGLCKLLYCCDMGCGFFFGAVHVRDGLGAAEILDLLIEARDVLLGGLDGSIECLCRRFGGLSFL